MRIKYTSPISLCCAHIRRERFKVEHPFRVIKRQFGQVKTRYRRLAKNRAQLFALGDLFFVRRKLMA